VSHQSLTEAGLDCHLITPRVDVNVSNELPCHVHWAVTKSESWTGGSSSQSVRYAVHFCHTFLTATEYLGADLFGVRCTESNTRSMFSGVRTERRLQPGGSLRHRPFSTPLFYPSTNYVWRRSFPLIKLSSKPLLGFFNWTCFNKQLHRTHALHDKLNYKVYAPFQSNVYPHPLVLLHTIKISKCFNISTAPCTFNS
jgi:hypothetical protein